MQSVVVFLGLFAINTIVGIIIRPISIFGILENIFNILIWFIILFVWIFSILNAYQGKVFKWPIAGNFAEKKVRG